MRILKVRFANINALKGRFEIDFTDPALAGAGIFAITGPTGSGKTTILDAITLALFGTTPRLKNISKSENELMTRGTGACQAEVEFETMVAGRVLTFRSSWEQHRARNSPEGALQAPKMYLVQTSEKCHTDDWETDKLSQVPARVEAVTGLDFDRFTRTCLLAQGQFAAFLEARTDDRAQILEQITGTEIYTRLSVEAFARDKAEAQKIEQIRAELQGVSLLPEEEFHALERLVAQLDQERQREEQQKQVLLQQITWVRARAALEETRQALDAQNQGWERERAAAGAELRRLSEGRRAEPLRLPLALRDSLREKRERKRQDLAEARQQLPGARLTLEGAELALRKKEAETAAFQQTAEGERERIKQIRSHDLQEKAVLGAQATVAQKRGQLETLRQATTAAVARLEETRLLLLAQAESRRTALETSGTDRLLGGDLKALEGLATQRREIARLLDLTDKEALSLARQGEAERAKVALLESELARAGLRAAERETDWSQATADLDTRFPGISATSLHEALSQAQNRLAATRSLKELAEEIRSHHQELAVVQAGITQRAGKSQAAADLLLAREREREAAAKAVDDLAERRAALQTMASLESHRRTLQPGQPCPLCGSLEHPFVAGRGELPPDILQAEALLDTAKAELQAIDTALKEATRVRIDLATEQAAAEQAAKGHLKTLAALQKKWDRLSGELSAKTLPQDQQAQEELLAQAEQALAEVGRTLQDWQAAVERRDAAGKAVTEAKQVRQNLEIRLAEERGNLQQIQIRVEDAEGRVRTLTGQRATIESQLEKDLSPYGIGAFGEEVLPTLRDRWQAWQRNQQELEEATRKGQEILKDLATCQAQLAGLDRQLEEIRTEAADLDRRLTESRLHRQEIYGARDPDAEEKAIEAKLAELHEGARSAALQVQSSRITVERLATTVSQLEVDENSLATELETAERAVAAAIEHAGYPDEEAGRQAILTPPEMQRLTGIEADLESRRTHLAGQLQAIVGQIEVQEQSRPTPRSLDELLVEERSAAERLAQACQRWQDQWKAWSTQQERRLATRALGDRLREAEAERRRWEMLCLLIGSADGKKFREFAHGLTFASLVGQANEQLQKFNDRYLLANEGLDLLVVDRFIADTRATVKNLSGGEKFLASLALALGLAQMVGQRHRMDTLFIDEGFGALDPQALETAVAALCGLQQQGKLIGVISHVESLKDRLPVRLELTRRGGGFSTLAGPGCSGSTFP